MPNVDYEWVRAQMQAAKTKVGVGNATLKLLEAWENLTLSAPQSKEVVALFAELALVHSIQPEVKDEVWVDAQAGQITVGDEVRVKADAYTGDTGTMHNGRRGKVVGIRYGDVIFRSTDDREPVLDGTHYSPYQLQKRVR